MKIQPVSSPHAVQQTQTNATEARSRAISAFMGPNTTQTTAGNTHNNIQEHPVQNATQVAAEEMTAIKAPTTQEESMEAAQETTEVDQTTETKTEPKADPRVSREFARLAREEKAFRLKAQQQEQAMKQREADLAAKEAVLADKGKTYETGYISRDQLKTDPLSVLAEAGVSYEELTQQIISQQPVDPRLQNTISQLKQEIQQLKSANEESKKASADYQTQQYQAAIKQITMEAKNLVKADPVAYEAISKTGTVKQVVKLIEETYKKDGVLMSVEEAAQEVENYLVDENYNMANKIDKIRRKLSEASTPKAASKPAQTPAETPKQQQPMKTLTNATGNSRQLSARERAVLAFKGELKS